MRMGSMMRGFQGVEELEENLSESRLYRAEGFVDKT